MCNEVDHFSMYSYDLDKLRQLSKQMKKYLFSQQKCLSYFLNAVKNIQKNKLHHEVYVLIYLNNKLMPFFVYPIQTIFLTIHGMWHLICVNTCNSNKSIINLPSISSFDENLPSTTVRINKYMRTQCYLMTSRFNMLS